MKARLAIYSLGIALMVIKTVEAQSASQSPGDGKNPATAKATDPYTPPKLPQPNKENPKEQ